MSSITALLGPLFGGRSSKKKYSHSKRTQSDATDDSKSSEFYDPSLVLQPSKRQAVKPSSEDGSVRSSASSASKQKRGSAHPLPSSVPFKTGPLYFPPPASSAMLKRLCSAKVTPSFPKPRPCVSHNNFQFEFALPQKFRCNLPTLQIIAKGSTIRADVYHGEEQMESWIRLDTLRWVPSQALLSEHRK